MHPPKPRIFMFLSKIFWDLSRIIWRVIMYRVEIILSFHQCRILLGKKPYHLFNSYHFFSSCYVLSSLLNFDLHHPCSSCLHPISNKFPDKESLSSLVYKIFPDYESYLWKSTWSLFHIPPPVYYHCFILWLSLYSIFIFLWVMRNGYVSPSSMLSKVYQIYSVPHHKLDWQNFIFHCH